jgi:hypothetical protein
MATDFINPQKATVRPTLRTGKKTNTQELVRELENYTRELEVKLGQMDRAIIQLQKLYDASSGQS